MIEADKGGVTASFRQANRQRRKRDFCVKKAEELPR
jgi:hypothetical protein